jgi:mannitol/fructose-specific phosphotransferase system IIA component (Ntr-type)
MEHMPDSPSEILADLIHEANILVDLPTEDHGSVIKALVQNMVSTDLVAKTHTSTVARLLNERELKGSTAIGGGVAIPHARIGFSEEPLMAFALLRDGAGFNSLDGAPVHFVFMVLTPKDDDETHLGVLKAITHFVKKTVHLKALAGCKTAAEVKSVFEDYAADE